MLSALPLALTLAASTAVLMAPATPATAQQQTPTLACSSTSWVKAKQYAAGSVVSYTNGNLYIARFANPGYVPTISTYYWSRYICSPAPKPAPAPVTPPVACSSPAWVSGRPYVAGNVVKYANGNLYIARYANPGYSPTVSTYYWSGYTCSQPAMPPPASLPACNGSSWGAGKPYVAGNVVSYADGKRYIAKFPNPGYNPSISTYYWAPYACDASPVVAAPPGYEAPLVSPGTWAVLGSSTAAGCCPQVSDWVRLVRQTYASRSVDIVNFAKGGTSTYDGLPGASQPVPYRPLPDPLHNVDAAMARSPKLVLVSYPTNDTDSGFSVDEAVRNQLAIRSRALAGGAAVIMVSTQPMNFSPEKLKQLDLIDERLSAVAPHCFVAVRKALAAPDGTLAAIYDSGDRRHPNDAGHAVIQGRIVSLIDAGQCVRVPASR